MWIMWSYARQGRGVLRLFKGSVGVMWSYVRKGTGGKLLLFRGNRDTFIRKCILCFFGPLPAYSFALVFDWIVRTQGLIPCWGLWSLYLITFSLFMWELRQQWLSRQRAGCTLVDHENVRLCCCSLWPRTHFNHTATLCWWMVAYLYRWCWPSDSQNLEVFNESSGPGDAGVCMPKTLRGAQFEDVEIIASKWTPMHTKKFVLFLSKRSGTSSFQWQLSTVWIHNVLTANQVERFNSYCKHFIHIRDHQMPGTLGNISKRI